MIHGADVSTFLRDPTHIGNVTPAIAGLLGSYALVGVMVGVLLAMTAALVAGLGLLGVMLTLLVPMARAQTPQRPARTEPVSAAVPPLRHAA